MPRADLLEIDRWVLAKYAECAEKIVAAYDDYDYPAIFQAANTFITVDLSAFYVDVTKDRMYTFGADVARRAVPARPRCSSIVDGLARLLAPILSVTMDELWRALPGERDAVGAHGAVPDGRRSGRPSIRRCSSAGRAWPSSATR